MLPDNWRKLLDLCDAFRETHAAEPPLERRAKSWARTLSFAQAALGAEGHLPRRGTAAEPFSLWVLGASDEVEVSLAEDGFFADVNWLDRAPTEVVIFGEHLRDAGLVSEAAEGSPPYVRTAGYAVLPRLVAARPPDLVAILMPDFRSPDEDPLSSPAPVPREILEAIGAAPVVVSTRFAFPERSQRLLQSLGPLLLLPQTRSPFSSSGSLEEEFADNNWVFAVRSPDAVSFALDMEVSIYPTEAGEPAEKLPTVFWGIVDLKYDTSQPVFERVRVLELGDGRISKFSGEGAALARRASERYQLQTTPKLRKYRMIAADKKLTHDLLQQAGCGHVVLQQACFQRWYYFGLGQEVATTLQAGENDLVVLKLLNRSRAAGVVVTPVDELEDVLNELLLPPKTLESWFAQHLKAIKQGSAADFGVKCSSFEEHCRHWWSNECPVFLAERWCASMPTERDGQRFDGTMRVGFALRRRAPPGGAAEAPDEAARPGLDVSSTKSSPSSTKYRLERGWWQESTKSTSPGWRPADAKDMATQQQEEQTQLEHWKELDVEWLGGYWKLPKNSMDSAHLRDRVVSAARKSGTAPVKQAHLVEVYAALAEGIRRLFGSVEPTAQTFAKQYKDSPELAGFFIARLSSSSKEIPKGRKLLYDALMQARKMEPNFAKCCLESFIHRASGVLEVKSAGAGAEWKNALNHFQSALRVQPTNANALYLMGTASLEMGQQSAAIDQMSKALLLDPDFKAPYVNLGVAYLRLGEFERVIEISEAGLARHPDSPQCHYHIGVAFCMMALFLEARESGGVRLLVDEADEYNAHRNRAREAFSQARGSDEGRKRRPEAAAAAAPGQGSAAGPASGSATRQPPWLLVDDEMVQAMSVAKRPTARPGGRARFVELPEDIGWRLMTWRV